MMNLLTPAQLVEKYTFLSRSAVYGACRDGLLSFYRIPSGHGKRGKYLINEADFLTWLESLHHVNGVEGDEPLTHIR